MTAKSVLPRSEATAVAGRFVTLLAGTYDRLELAGSIRRRLPAVGDIEIVAVPSIQERVERDLFGGVHATVGVDLLAARMEALADAGTVVPRTNERGGVLAWGPTARMFTYDGAPVDLFTPSADRYGWILALRTGPAAFARQLVRPKHDDAGRPLRTSDGRRGLMPARVRAQDGSLTDRVSGRRIETPDERDVFDLFGLDVIEPWERT